MNPPPLPPRLGPPQPPRLSPGFAPRSGPRRPRRTRWGVWVILALVVGLRLMLPQERVEIFRGFHPFEPRQGNRDPRGRRGMVHVPERVAEVPPDLLRIHIEVAPKDADILRGYYWQGGPSNGQERPEVLATVREGDTVYTNVALHLKGSAGSFQPFDSKPALTLSFSKHVSGRRFHGLNKISLNNSVQDPSYLCEAVCRELFEAAGVPVPKADHATVVLNGRDLGLYVLTEGWGKPFLKRHFRNADGNLYDGGFIQDLDGNLSVNSGDQPDDRSDISRLLAAAFHRDPASRWSQLERVLDMDRFLTFLALETLTCHWDGYAQNRNNYRLFHDLDTDKMIFMPHGMDQMFGGGGRAGTTSSIFPSMRGTVARAVLNTPEGRKGYLDRMAALQSTVFVAESITNRIRELARRIRPTLAAYGEPTARQHDAQVEWLCQRVAERVQSVAEQLAAPRDPVTFNAEGSASLSGWSPRITAQEREPFQFERAESDQGPVLRIRAVRGSGRGSWRTRALLESGRYRFEGRFRAEDLRAGGGVCLRISGANASYHHAQDGQWEPLAFWFTVDEPAIEVELVCELAASRGSVEFDEASLRLVRE